MRLALCALLLAACASSPPPAPAAARSAAMTAAPAADIADPPFTVEQIRAASPAGRTIDFQITAEGAPAVRRRMRFTAVSPTEAEVEISIRDDKDQPVGTPQVGKSTWAELHAHAHFPRASTVVAEESVTVPIGTFTCRKYTVTHAEVSPPRIDRFWFATDLPGPPVQFSTEVGGKVVMLTRMVDHVAGK